MHDPYRHSVWIDVFGILLLGALLLGGAGYLLVHAGRMVPGGERSGGGDESLSAVTRPSPAPSPGRAFNLETRGEPLADRQGDPARGGIEAPFSASWRQEATPDLSGPAPPSSGGPRGDRVGGDPLDLAGPSTGRQVVEEQRTRSAQNKNVERSTRAPWLAEAQRLGRQTRALSRELGQMDREENSTASKNESAAQGSSGGTAKTSGPGLPDNPDPVPIDDHLHWLVVAGILWGSWRIGRGA